MRRSTLPFGTLGVVGGIVLLALLLGQPVGATFFQEVTPDPPPARPTALPAPYVEVAPSQAVGLQDTFLAVTGHHWPTGGPGVMLFFDQRDGSRYLLGPLFVGSDGSFSVSVIVPGDWALPGHRRIIAFHDQGAVAEAVVLFIAPTPTDTPTVTNTPTATNTPGPPDTPAPSPTATATETSTPTPTSTPLTRPITPIVTNTPVPPPVRYPSTRATATPRPTSPPAPSPTSVTPSPTPIIIAVVSPTPTPTDTSTPSPTPTDTPTPTPTDTSTPTPTPTDTPTPLPMPASDTSQAMLEPTSPVPLGLGPAAGMPEAGQAWQAAFATGLIVGLLLLVLVTAFATVALATVLVIVRRGQTREARDQF
jgi:hypothetical protein